MTKRSLILTTFLIPLLGLTLLAGPLSGTWQATLAIDPNPFSFAELSSTFTGNYTVGGFTATSNSPPPASRIYFSPGSSGRGLG